MSPETGNRHVCLVSPGQTRLLHTFDGFEELCPRCQTQLLHSFDGFEELSPRCRTWLLHAFDGFEELGPCCQAQSLASLTQANRNKACNIQRNKGSPDPAEASGLVPELRPPAGTPLTNPPFSAPNPEDVNHFVRVDKDKCCLGGMLAGERREVIKDRQGGRPPRQL